MVLDNLPELRLILAVIGITQHVLVVTLMVGILIGRYHVHVHDTYVDAEARLADPVEVDGLGEVCDVVGGFQVTSTMEILHEDVI